MTLSEDVAALREALHYALYGSRCSRAEAAVLLLQTADLPARIAALEHKLELSGELLEGHARVCTRLEHNLQLAEAVCEAGAEVDAWSPIPGQWWSDKDEKAILAALADLRVTILAWREGRKR